MLRTTVERPNSRGWNSRMRGNEKVLRDLSESLKAELTAISQYFLHAKMCENWGYFRLGAFYRKESIEEMVHAEKLMNRILFLDGTPNMTDIGPSDGHVLGRSVRHHPGPGRIYM